MPIPKFIDRFFFSRVSAQGFGLMRMLWGATLLCFGFLAWGDVWRYYSDQGFLPVPLMPLMQRMVYRFSLLDYITSPGGVYAVYLLLLVLAALVMIGYRTRLSTILCFVLLCSFHERNYMPLAGGETVIRLVGFLLVICPNISAFSVDRLRAQWKSWKQNRTLLGTPTMSIWPYRLLLWQLLVLYVSSAWDKVLGTMWWSGTAVASALHHPNFMRAPMWISDYVSVLSLPISRLTIVFEFAWLLLLIPSFVTVKWLGFKPGTLKRVVLAGGILFHGSILILMHVGSFPYALFTAYVGLLLDEDLATFRGWANRHLDTERIYILFDGFCSMCQKSTFWLVLMDWLKRTELVDFRKEEERLKVAPDIPFAQLNKALHVRFAKTARNPILGNETLSGFDGLRRLAWHLPPLWIVAPFLYIPGVPFVGRMVYARIASQRHVCDGPDCTL